MAEAAAVRGVVIGLEQVLKTLEAVKHNGKEMPALFGRLKRVVKILKALLGQGLGSEQPQLDQAIVESINEAGIVLKEARDLCFKYMLASSLARFFLAQIFQARIKKMDVKLDRVIGEIDLALTAKGVVLQSSSCASAPRQLTVEEQAALSQLQQVASVQGRYDSETTRRMAVLAKGSKEDQANAAYWVASSTSHTPAACREVADCGMTPFLVELLDGHRDSFVRRCAAITLFNLWQDANTAARVVAAGGIPLLMGYLLSEVPLSRTVVGVSQALGVEDLVNLVWHCPEHLPAFVNAGGLPFLVRLMASPDQDQQRRGALFMVNLGCRSPGLSAAVVSAGGVPSLVHLLETEGEALQGQEGWVLANSDWRSPGCFSAILSVGAPAPLLHQLEEANQETQEQGEWFLASLVRRGPEDLVGIASKGVIPYLGRQLEALSRDVERKRGRVIASLAWRAPEGQTATGVSTFAEAYNFVIQLAEKMDNGGLAQEQGVSKRVIFPRELPALPLIHDMSAATPLLQLLERLDTAEQRKAAPASAGYHPEEEDVEATGSGDDIISLLWGLDSTDQRVQGLAAKARANMFRDPNYLRAITSASGRDSSLVHLLGVEDLHVQGQAQAINIYLPVKVTADIPSHWLDMGVNVKELSRLKQRLEASDDLVAQLRAEWALGKLTAENARRAPALISAGTIPTLIRLLESKDNHTQHRATMAVALGADNDSIPAIISAGAIPPLVQLLESLDRNVQHGAAWAIDRLADGTADVGAAIMSAGGFPPLVRLLESKDTGVQLQAIEAMFSLAGRTAKNRAALVSAGAIPLLVRLLDSKDKDVQRWGASVLGVLAMWSAENGVAIMSAGAIPPLMRHLESKSRAVQSHAAKAIANLALRSAEPRAAIVSAGAIPLLVRLLESKDKDVQQGAAASITNLTVNAEHISAIASAGAIPLLVRLLESQDKDVLHLTAWSIAKLASMGTTEHRATIVSAGGIPLIVRLLEGKDMGVQAAWVFDTLAEEDTVALITQGPPLPGTRLLESKDKDVQLRAWLVAILHAEIPEHAPAIVSAGAIPPLVRLLESKDKDVQCGAAAALVNLAAGNAEHRAAIVSAGAIPPLVRLLESQDRDFKLDAAAAIVNLADRTAENRAAIVSAGAIPLLVRLLDSKDKDLQYRAAYGILNLTTWTAEHAPATISAGAIPLLVRLLHSKDKDVQEMAAAALESFILDIRYVVPGHVHRELEQKLHTLAHDPSQTQIGRCDMCGDGMMRIRGPMFFCKDCPRPPGVYLCGSCMDKTESNLGRRLWKEHMPDHRMVLRVTAVHIIKAAKELMMPEDEVTRLLELSVVAQAHSTTVAASPSSLSLDTHSLDPGSTQSSTAASTSPPLSPAAKHDVQLEEVVHPLEPAGLNFGIGSGSSSKLGLGGAMALGALMGAALAALAALIAYYCMA